jgi:hypothetical protein
MTDSAVFDVWHTCKCEHRTSPLALESLCCTLKILYPLVKFIDGYAKELKEYKEKLLELGSSAVVYNKEMNFYGIESEEVKDMATRNFEDFQNKYSNRLIKEVAQQVDIKDFPDEAVFIGQNDDEVESVRNDLKYVHWINYQENSPHSGYFNYIGCSFQLIHEEAKRLYMIVTEGTGSVKGDALSRFVDYECLYIHLIKVEELLHILRKETSEGILGMIPGSNGKWTPTFKDVMVSISVRQQNELVVPPEITSGSLGAEDEEQMAAAAYTKRMLPWSKMSFALKEFDSMQSKLENKYKDILFYSRQKAEVGATIIESSERQFAPNKRSHHDQDPNDATEGQKKFKTTARNEKSSRT